MDAVSRTRHGELLERPGRRAWVRTARDELVVVEVELDGGADGAGPHFHRRHVDSFYVLDGKLEFMVDGETITAGAGMLVVAAPGVVHAFRNASADTAHYLNMHTPGVRFAEYMRRLDAGEEFDRTEYDMWEVTHPARCTGEPVVPP